MIYCVRDLLGFLGNGLLLAVCAEILVQLCADPAVVCAGWEGDCKGDELMNMLDY